MYIELQFDFFVVSGQVHSDAQKAQLRNLSRVARTFVDPTKRVFANPRFRSNWFVTMKTSLCGLFYSSH
jgi:hypothetical protein